MWAWFDKETGLLISFGADLGNMMLEVVVLEDGLSIEKAFELLKKQANGELDAAELNSVSGGMKLGFTAKSGLVRL